ncbi:MAG: hypothetical protein BGO51_13920 [Rhodospirillales bacterium 69-11]|nr:MAG: hypothetical protein BGO51_13920 [Rhodospirillales bacterium 69-11]
MHAATWAMKESANRQEDRGWQVVPRDFDSAVQHVECLVFEMVRVRRYTLSRRYGQFDAGQRATGSLLFEQVGLIDAEYGLAPTRTREGDDVATAFCR